ITFILTFLIIIAGILLITESSIGGKVQNMKPFFANGLCAFVPVVIMTPLMFVGFEILANAPERITSHPRNIRTSLIFSVVLTGIWYVAIIYGVSRVLDASDMTESNLVTADAMAKAFGNSQMMGNILVLGGIGGILTSWIGFYVGGSRAIYALAKAGMLPKSLGKL